jgi:hypothetical protein
MATISRYRHTQVGTVILVSLAIPALVLALALTAGAAPVSLLPLLGVFLACMVLFGSLTVEVDRAAVSLWFGFRLIRRRFPLAEVRNVSVVRNPWYYGLGIRLLPRGWLYNVSGLDAVEIEMAGGRAHRIGTDEPEALAAAIQRARGLAD